MIAQGYYIEVALVEFISFVLLLCVVSTFLSYRFHPSKNKSKITHETLLAILFVAVIVQIVRGLDPCGVLGIFPVPIVHFMQPQNAALVMYWLVHCMCNNYGALQRLMRQDVSPYFRRLAIAPAIIFHIGEVVTALLEYTIDYNTASDQFIFRFLLIRTSFFFSFSLLYTIALTTILIRLRISVYDFISQLRLIEKGEIAAADMKRMSGPSRETSSSGRISTDKDMPGDHVNMQLHVMPSTQKDVCPTTSDRHAASAHQNHDDPTHSHVSASSTRAVHKPKLSATTIRIMRLEVLLKQVFALSLFIYVFALISIVFLIVQYIQYANGTLGLDEFMITDPSKFQYTRLTSDISQLGTLVVLTWYLFADPRVWTHGLKRLPFWRTVSQGARVTVREAKEAAAAKQLLKQPKPHHVSTELQEVADRPAPSPTPISAGAPLEHRVVIHATVEEGDEEENARQEDLQQRQQQQQQQQTANELASILAVDDRFSGGIEMSPLGSVVHPSSQQLDPITSIVHPMPPHPSVQSPLHMDASMISINSPPPIVNGTIDELNGIIIDESKLQHA